MKIIINGQQFATDQVTVSLHGFHNLKSWPTFEYCIIVESKELLLKFAKIYEKCIVELKRDDEIAGEFTPPYPGANRYPKLTELFSLAEKDLMVFVNTYFDYDILSLLVPTDKVGPDVRWVLRSLESIILNEKDMIIKGRASEMPRLSR